MATKFFVVANIAPMDVLSQPEGVRLDFYRLALDLTLQRKQWELSMGLNAQGKKLPGVLPETQKHRKSAMDPALPWRLTGPYLAPARKLSRTRSLLTGQAYPTHVRITWKFDPHVGDAWTRILAYHAARGRAYDVIGLSPRGRLWVANEAIKRWRAKTPLPPPRIYRPPPVDWTPPNQPPPERPWAAGPRD